MSSTLSTPIKWLVSLSAISFGPLTYHRYSILRAGVVVSTSFRRGLRVTHAVSKPGENQSLKAVFPLGCWYWFPDSRKEKPGFEQSLETNLAAVPVSSDQG